MSNFLYPVASHWAGSAVDCRFKLLADNAPVAPLQETLPAFEIPNGVSQLKLTVTPTVTDYWEVEVTFEVSNTGDLRVTDSSDPFLRLRGATGNGSRGHVVLIKVSRFRDVTTLATAPTGTPNVLEQLRNPPARRRIKDRNTGIWAIKDVKEVEAHQKSYGDWPPPDWNLHAVPDAHFLDPKNPLSQTGLLNFAKAPTLSIDADNVVLRSAGGKVPELFNVTWPKTIAPSADSRPTRFLVYFRQTNKGNKYDEDGLFIGGDLDAQRYPFNFDYADTGLFESLHYEKLPPPPPGRQWLDPSEGPLRSPNAKGVPYQVARSGFPIVTVMPCGMFGTEYGILKDTEQLARILEEIQAFMFWRAGVADPPPSIGRTALAAFSSANYGLGEWLADPKNLKADGFLLNRLKAVYFLDPPIPAVDGCITAALKWAEKTSDARIRLYSQYRMDQHRTLLGLKPTDKLPPAPYVLSGLNNTRTATALPDTTWSATFADLFKPRKFTYDWAAVHHTIPGTMLTHALAQEDLKPDV